MSSVKIKSSKGLYFVSVLVLIFGIGLFVLLLVNGINSTVDKINMQVVVPGSKVLDLKDTGKYTIFLEYDSVVDGKVYETRDISGLMCSLYNRNSREYIELKNVRSNSKYSIGGRQGRSLFTFEIDQPGKYEIKGWYEEDRDNEVVLSIGKGFVGSLVFSIIGSIGVLFIAIGASIGFLNNAIKKAKK